MAPRRHRARYMMGALVLVAIASPIPAFTAGYGSGGFGGHAYGVEAPAPAPVRNQPAGGGVVSGPLSVGYLVSSTSSPTASLPASVDTSSPNVPARLDVLFEQPLQYRARHGDVRRLQEYLNTHGFLLAAAGDGSPGLETDYFGALTYRALIRLQEAHSAAILAPLRLTQGTGYFGPSTVRFVNSQITMRQ